MISYNYTICQTTTQLLDHIQTLKQQSGLLLANAAGSVYTHHKHLVPVQPPRCVEHKEFLALLIQGKLVESMVHINDRESIRAFESVMQVL